MIEGIYNGKVYHGRYMTEGKGWKGYITERYVIEGIYDGKGYDRRDI
jgi:hypothetical protein